MTDYPFDWESIAGLDDDEYDEWLENMDRILLQRADEFGITPEDVARIRSHADAWRRNRKLGGRQDPNQRDAASGALHECQRLLVLYSGTPDKSSYPH